MNKLIIVLVFFLLVIILGLAFPDRVVIVFFALSLVIAPICNALIAYFDKDKK